MVKTRFSVREKKILLRLLKLDEGNTPHTSFNRSMEPIISSFEKPHPWNHRLNSISYNRTFRGLSENGLVKRRSIDGPSAQYRCWLTDNGREKAEEIRDELKKYFDEWGDLI